MAEDQILLHEAQSTLRKQRDEIGLRTIIKITQIISQELEDNLERDPALAVEFCQVQLQAIRHICEAQINNKPNMIDSLR